MIRIHQVNGGFVEIKRRRPRKKKSNRKRGRPKKEKVVKKVKQSRKQPFSIILTSRGKQKECIKTFRTLDDAYEYFYNIIEKNKNIMFPVRYLNYKGIVEAKYELYIIERLDDAKTKDIALLRDDMGKFIMHDTNIDGWQIIDKINWDIEETFWVNGFDPKLQRKDFKWIIENIIGYDKKNLYLFKNVLVYQNKLIVDTSNYTDIVFCKCVDDAFRLYNAIEEWCLNKKYKNIMFSGNLRDYSRATISSWIDKLCEVTGFDRLKIKRNSLRP